MTDFQYKQAPIIEAVVEFRSSSPIDEKKRQKALKRLKKNYTNHRPVVQKDIKVEVRAQSIDSIRDQLSSENMTQKLHITDKSFLISRLAPYTGWEGFKQRITRDWDIWQRTVGFQSLERIGMRYINRIDIPITGPVVHYEDYVTVYPALPPLLDPSLYHSVNVIVPLDNPRSMLSLKSSIVESPIPNHLAIVLDLDIAQIYKTLPSNDEIYSFLSLARTKKNEIFETCITDKSRELFNQ